MQCMRSSGLVPLLPRDNRLYPSLSLLRFLAGLERKRLRGDLSHLALISVPKTSPTLSGLYGEICCPPRLARLRLPDYSLVDGLGETAMLPLLPREQTEEGSRVVERKGADLASCNGRLGVCVAAGWVVVLLSALVGAALSGAGPGAFVAVGPNDKAVFATVRVDSMAKWSALMAYSSLSQAAQSLVETTLQPFIINVIRDPNVDFSERRPSPRNFKACAVVAQFVVGVYNLFLCIVSLFDILMYVTLRIQFYIPAIVADLLVNGYVTHQNMQQKRQSEGVKVGGGCVGAYTNAV
jgi:hypothetical protein